MSTLFILLLSLIALCNAVSLPAYKKGRLVAGPGFLARKTAISAQEQCEAKGSKNGLFCSSCDNLLVCNANGGALVPCAQLNAKTKYCVNGACQATLPSNVVCSVDSFICNAEGYLPDPANCAVYYLCEAPGSTAWQFNCEAGYAFDITTNQCKLRRYSTDCAVMPCTNGVVRFVPYPPQKSVYGFCDGTAKPATVYRCEDDQYQEFDLTSYSCKVACKKAGNQVNRYDCKTYHYCYAAAGKLVWDLRTCPTGYSFDPKLLYCVKKAICVNELPIIVNPPVTDPPITNPPVTDPPVTNPPVTDPPITDPPVTNPPVTNPPITDPPITNPPVTDPPVTNPPVTDPPITDPPVTNPTVTNPPITDPPITNPPVTDPPVTNPPATDPPITDPPITNPPVTDPPVTISPVTDPPITNPPVTNPPVTNPPATNPPITDPPITNPPITDQPVTNPPITDPAVVTDPPPVNPECPESAIVC